ncbi:MAG: DNA-methyltransferase [Candidatus Hodarchaeota archaeon]
MPNDSDKNNSTVAEKRGYRVRTVEEAKKVATAWLEVQELKHAIAYGLPEIDDRYHIWRISLLNNLSKARVGEVVIDAYSADIIEEKSTKTEILRGRLSKGEKKAISKKKSSKYILSSLMDTIALGNSAEILPTFPVQSVDLIFTSPPYYNARPEYSDFISYEDYLESIRKVIQQCSRVLIDGRFFVMNTAPVLLRRISRQYSSKRIAVPFDVHQIFIEEGYDFIDDILWMKPEGAGWATGRGRRFAADRTPLQYKAVPVTEYVLVYRKQTEKLIDWHIRKHPNPELVKASKIAGEYEKTNVWQIKPAYDKRHPAIFPLELAEKIIKYYSFVNDVVLDPFAGIGTVGEAAVMHDRKFVLIDISKDYVEAMCAEAPSWFSKYNKKQRKIKFLNCMPKKTLDKIISGP